MTVDTFFDHAREQYDGETTDLTSADIRQASFPLRRGGFRVAEVDAALDRLEIAFAQREREREVEELGADAWLDKAKVTAQMIVDRLQRPSGHKFNTTGWLSSGYNKSQVEALSKRIIAVFCVGTPLNVEDLRQAVFTRQTNGYDEQQVDELLDRTVQTLLAVD